MKGGYTEKEIEIWGGESMRGLNEKQAKAAEKLKEIWILKVADRAEKHKDTLDSWGLSPVYEIDPESPQ